MTRRYKVKRSYRLVITSAAVITSLPIFYDLFTFCLYGNQPYILSIFVILIGCSLILLYLAAESNSLTYLITDEEFIIKSFLKIEKHYPIREISTIELHGILFPSIYIYLSRGKKITLLPIDDEREFLSALTERQKKYGTAWTFIKRDEEW